MFDVLLSRYHDMNFILTLDIDTVIRLIRKAYIKQDEERNWQLYVSVYPHFDKKTFKTFEQFYKPPAETVSTRSAEDIIAHAEAMLKKAGGKDGDF